MAEQPENQGLRERKKEATRAKLIDAAADLVDKQGYASTTVEQIANAVDVSPRTVAHYFPSKDRLLLSLADDYAEAVTEELARLPIEQPALRAMLSANLALLDRPAGQEMATTAERIATLLRTLDVSKPLQPLSTSLRPPAMVEEMARRMGTEPTDRRVELVFAVWSAVARSGWTGVSKMYATGQVDAAGLPALLKQRLIDAFDELVTLSD